MKMNKHAVGHILSTFTIFVWGTTFISTKILLREFTPVEILFYRFMIGIAALMVIYPHRLKFKSIKQELTYACAGLCGITLYFLLENIALTYSFASNIAVIISVAPLFTALLASRFLTGERLRLNFFIGFVTAITGIFLISFNGNTQIHINPVGDLLAVLAAAVWGIYSVLTKKISTYGYHTIQTTKRIFFYGLVFMIPALFLFNFRLGVERLQNPVNLFNILFLSLGASALCFVTWNYAVKVLGAVKTSIYIYISPVITVITSVIILKEVITGALIIGSVLTMAGLFISKSDIRMKKKEIEPVQNHMND